jgi:hypothetical protein
MSTRASSPKPGVFGPYAAERSMDRANIETVYCGRCPQFGRKTEIVFGTDAIGRTTERCPACDGVAVRRDPPNPNEVLRPQALIPASRLLPPCPPGKLRCQNCAKPVAGDARLCAACELPGLSSQGWDSEHVPVGAVLRAAREAAGIAQTEAARRMGLAGRHAASGVSRLESDEYHSHTLTSLNRFAAAVGCRVIVRFARVATEDGQA